MNEDARLIDEALAGNARSFGELVRKYQDRLFNTMFQIVGSREEAEDVVQDSFVQAFIKLNSFQGARAFYTWLYRIAFNVSVSRRRRKRPDVSIDAIREVTGNDPISVADSPTARLEREESVEQVQRALDRLNEEHRSILILREMEGFCYEEISNVLNMPIGTVRSRLHRARIQLREELKETLEARFE